LNDPAVSASKDTSVSDELTFSAILFGSLNSSLREPFSSALESTFDDKDDLAGKNGANGDETFSQILFGALNASISRNPEPETGFGEAYKTFMATKSLKSLLHGDAAARS
jgi:hypothetical protein